LPWRGEGGYLGRPDSRGMEGTYIGLVFPSAKPSGKVSLQSKSFFPTAYPYNCSITVPYILFLRVDHIMDSAMTSMAMAMPTDIGSSDIFAATIFGCPLVCSPSCHLLLEIPADHVSLNLVVIYRARICLLRDRRPSLCDRPARHELGPRMLQFDH